MITNNRHGCSPHLEYSAMNTPSLFCLEQPLAGGGDWVKAAKGEARALRQLEPLAFCRVTDLLTCLPV